MANNVYDAIVIGLGSSSGELGHNVMDHHFQSGASGVMEGYEDKYYYGHPLPIWRSQPVLPVMQ